MRIAIMQPTYLPWMGYFGMMDSVDVFVLLDSVQFARRSWQQRNQIKTPNGPGWLTVPVLSKGKRGQLIRDVVIDIDKKFFQNHIRIVEYNYKKAPFFQNYSSELFTILSKRHEGLVALTIELMEWLKQTLGISTPFNLSSELGHEGSKASLLADLCVRLGANEYISPPGSMDYLNKSDSFKKRGIAVRYFQYNHPEYSQCFGEFIPYMSVIDLLLNVGPESPAIIRKGYETQP